MAACKPELRTVSLDLPVEANTLFYPTCVRLEQCGGCCYGPLLICRPKVTKAILLKVRVWPAVEVVRQKSFVVLFLNKTVIVLQKINHNWLLLMFQKCTTTLPLTVCFTQVLKTKISAGRSSSRREGRSRRRRETVPSYHEVEVQKHEVCECGCKVREEDCNPTIHTYYEGECSCNCNNR